MRSPAVGREKAEALPLARPILREAVTERVPPAAEGLTLTPSAPACALGQFPREGAERPLSVTFATAPSEREPRRVTAGDRKGRPCMIAAPAG